MTVMSVAAGIRTRRVREERDRIVALLRSSGLRATADPRNAQLPVALLQRPNMVPLGNACQNLRIEWTLHLLVKGGDNAATWDRLEDMREAVWPLLLNQITSCDADTYPINDTTEIPAYRITFETVL